MSYYINKVIDIPFEEAVSKVTGELKKNGFGILTDIDVKSTLKEKLNVDFRKYRILGACNPPFAYQAFQMEDKIGLMMPCNVVVQEITESRTEVAAVDPAVSMSAVGNMKLEGIAGEVRQKLLDVIQNL